MGPLISVLAGWLLTTSSHLSGAAGDTATRLSATEQCVGGSVSGVRVSRKLWPSSVIISHCDSPGYPFGDRPTRCPRHGCGKIVLTNCRSPSDVRLRRGAESQNDPPVELVYPFQEQLRRTYFR